MKPILIDLVHEDADWPKRTDDSWDVVFDIRDEFCAHGTLLAACYDAKCRPPTSGGTGGSLPRRVSGTPADVAPLGNPQMDEFEERIRPRHSALENSVREVIGVPTATEGSLITSAEGLTWDDRVRAKVHVQQAIASRLLDDPEFVKWADKLMATPVEDIDLGTMTGFSEMDIGGVRRALSALDDMSTGGVQVTLGDVLKVENPKPGERWETPAGRLALEMTDKMVSQWASSSGDDKAASIAMQIAAAQEHGMGSVDKVMGTYTRPVTFRAASEIANGGFGFAMRAFVRAEYAETQAYFARIGVSEVTLYRGMGLHHAEVKAMKEAGEVPVRSNPLSSWAWIPSVAVQFASDRGSAGENAPLVIAMRVPVSAIQSIPVTGRGCLSEREALVLDGDATATVMWADA